MCRPLVCTVPLTALKLGAVFVCITVEKLQTDWLLLLLLNRALLLAELEKEEKEKGWYYAQLQNLTKRIDSLPLTENVSLLTLDRI